LKEPSGERENGLTMTGKDFAKNIAVLGSLCGITSQYRDNFGRRHRTSQATYRDLLSAMGVPWEDPEGLDREIARRRLGPWGAMLSPVQLIKAAHCLAGAISCTGSSTAPQEPKRRRAISWSRASGSSQGTPMAVSRSR